MSYSSSRASLIFLEAGTNSHLIKLRMVWKIARKGGSCVRSDGTSQLLVSEGRANVFQATNLLIHIPIFMYLFLSTRKSHMTVPCPWLKGKKTLRRCGWTSTAFLSFGRKKSWVIHITILTLVLLLLFQSKTWVWQNIWGKKSYYLLLHLGRKGLFFGGLST